MKRAVLVALASLGVAAGLAVTASSTTHEAYAAGMRGIALAAIVVVLEVTNVLGTVVLLTDSRRWACWQAGGFVALASLVTGWCGVLTYSWVGLVGPVFVLGGVHLARLAATAPGASQGAGDAPHVARMDEQEGDTDLWTPEARPSSGQVQVNDLHRSGDGAAPVGDQGVNPAETPEPPTSPAFAQGAPDEVIVAALLAREELPGRDAVKAEFRCGTKKAERVLAQAAEHRRPHLVTAREAMS